MKTRMTRNTPFTTRCTKTAVIRHVAVGVTFVLVVVAITLVVCIPTSTTAYVTNNNNNNNNKVTKATTTTTKIHWKDWLPKNTAFLPKHNLSTVQQQLIDAVFNIQLDIETKSIADAATTGTTRTSKKLSVATTKSSLPRLPIRNLHLTLGGGSGDDDSSSSNRLSMTNNERARSKTTMTSIPMPGVNGPHPMVSSGILPIHIENCGEYITLHTGIQSLPLTTTTTSSTENTNDDDTTTTTIVGQFQPQWEVIWKDQSPMGTIVCGMELQQSIQRNPHAMIPAGLLYLSFPIWDATVLADYQTKKIQHDKTAQLYAHERDTALEQMTTATNVLNKLLHYRDAFTAAEKYSLQPHQMYRHVPTNINDLIAIPNEQQQQQHRIGSDDDTGSDDADTDIVAPPQFYIVPKGTVRIMPSSSSLSTQQAMMNRMLLLSSSRSSTDDPTHAILQGTAKMTMMIPTTATTSNVIPPPTTTTMVSINDISSSSDSLNA